MSRTTVLSPAALTMGQKVSLLTSVTFPTAAPTVSKLDLTTTLLWTLLLLLGTAFLLVELHEDEDGKNAICCFAAQGNDADDRTD